MTPSKQPSYKLFLALKDEFLQIRPVFAGMPDFAQYNMAKKFYDKLSTQNLSTLDFENYCGALSKTIAVLKKDANYSITPED